MESVRPDAVNDRPPADETSWKIVAAAREEFVRLGVRRANMGDIARRAGVARVTLYRRFDGKPTLLRAVVMADVVEFVARFDDELFGSGSPADRIARATSLSIAELRTNPLMVSALRSDPEMLVNALTLEGQAEFELIKGLLAVRIAALADRGEIAVEDPARVAEFMLRLVYSAVLMPYGQLPGRTDAEIRGFIAEFVAPLLEKRPS